MTGKDIDRIVGEEPVIVQFLRNFVGPEAVVCRSLSVGHIGAVLRKETAHTRFGMEVEATLMVGLGNRVWMEKAMG